MFTKQEASQLRQQFWTSFGQYMSPIPSAEGVKVNWINYRTGIKDLYFKMQADNKTASISILLVHNDITRQTEYFNQFVQVKSLLHNALDEEWQWALQVQDEYGKTVSCISTSISGVNIFRKEDWPAIISFFKPRIIALDAFWAEMKCMFDAV